MLVLSAKPGGFLTIVSPEGKTFRVSAECLNGGRRIRFVVDAPGFKAFRPEVWERIQRAGGLREEGGDA